MSEPTDEWERGLRAYREGRYFDAHEHWEQLWRAETDAERRLVLQALVQLAAALHKLDTGIRPGGAPALLDRAADKLGRVRAGCFGVRPAELGPRVRRVAEQARQALGAGGGPPYPVDVPEVVGVT